MQKDDLSRIIKDISEELNELKEYVSRYKKKLYIIQEFIIGWNKSAWGTLEDELLAIKKISFLDIEELYKKEKYSNEMLEAISIERNNASKEGQEYFDNIINSMNILNKIFRRLRNNLIAQAKWVEKNKENIWKHHHKIQELLRLVKKEADLLYKHELIKSKNEKEILIDIYNMIMPLKDRIEKREEMKMRPTSISRVTKFKFIGEDPFMFKRIGVIRDWSREDAKKRLNVIEQYYAYLNSRGVPLPPLNNLYAIARHVNSDKMAGSDNFLASVKQTCGGLDGKVYFRKEKNIKIIENLYMKMLVVLNRATEGYTVLPWLYDFSPQNFAITPTGDIIFVDLDPPGWDAPHNYFRRVDPRKIKVFGNTGSSNKNYFFRMATANGQFMHFLEMACGARLDLTKFFVELTLDFLEKAGRKDVLKFLRKFVKTNEFKNTIKRMAG